MKLSQAQVSDTYVAPTLQPRIVTMQTQIVFVLICAQHPLTAVPTAFCNQYAHIGNITSEHFKARHPALESLALESADVTLLMCAYWLQNALGTAARGCCAHMKTKECAPALQSNKT